METGCNKENIIIGKAPVVILDLEIGEQIYKILRILPRLKSWVVTIYLIYSSNYEITVFYRHL